MLLSISWIVKDFENILNFVTWFVWEEENEEVVNKPNLHKRTRLQCCIERNSCSYIAQGCQSLIFLSPNFVYFFITTAAIEKIKSVEEKSYLPWRNQVNKEEASKQKRGLYCWLRSYRSFQMLKSIELFHIWFSILSCLLLLPTEPSIYSQWQVVCRVNICSKSIVLRTFLLTFLLLAHCVCRKRKGKAEEICVFVCTRLRTCGGPIYLPLHYFFVQSTLVSMSQYQH